MNTHVLLKGSLALLVAYGGDPPPGQMPGVSANGWGHPVCSADAVTIAASLPVKRQ
jgi:hypothetical protein